MVYERTVILKLIATINTPLGVGNIFFGIMHKIWSLLYWLENWVVVWLPACNIYISLLSLTVLSKYCYKLYPGKDWGIFKLPDCTIKMLVSFLQS